MTSGGRAPNPNAPRASSEQSGSQLASVTDSNGTGTVTATVTPASGSPVLVKVGNYIPGLTINQLDWLSTTNLAAMTPLQVGALTPAQVDSL